MLISGAAALDHAQRIYGKGLEGEARIDWPALMSFKRTFTDPMPEKIERGFAKKGIDAYPGLARFTGRNSLEEDGEQLEAEHILIAAGAEPVKLDIPGEEHLISNEEFLALGKLPKKIVLVGGGYRSGAFTYRCPGRC